MKNKIIPILLLAVIFLLSPAPAGAFRFISWADTKSGTAALKALSLQAAPLSPVFTLFPGDVCDAGPDATCFSAWKNAINGGTSPGNGMFSKTFATRGNHDSAGTAYWVSQFNVVNTAASIGATHVSQLNTNLTYSFDYGNSHFVAADMPGGDSSGLTSAVISWIDADLTAAEAPERGITHAFLFFHGPVYYADGHTGSTAPDSFIQNVINRHPIVSAVFTGHEHLMAYTHLDAARRSNITHPFEQFITGAAGAGLYACTAGRSDYCISQNSFATIDVNGNDYAVNLYQQGITNPVKTYNFSKSAAPTNTPGVTATPTVKPASSPTPTVRPTVTPTRGPTNTPSSSPTPGTDLQPQFPIRAAFYYPWFPESWTQSGVYPFTKYEPSLGYYSAYDSAILVKHIQAMQYGKIQAGISSWWGQTHHTNTKFPGLLRAADNTAFRWAIYYENESTGDPTVSQIQSDLTYIKNNYGNDKNYLRVNGKFVVFVYADDLDGCTMADRWKQANTVNAYIILKVFAGFKTCTSQPDSWHQYSPAVASDSQTGYSYSISPAFDKYGEATRLARDITRWQTDVKNMVSSNAPFELVTTFNEWGEGTAVESATQWTSASGYGDYLDALHYDGNPPANKPGDADGNGVVNMADMVKWLNGYIRSLSGVINGEFDGNGKVDGKDFIIWMNNFGK
jgi:hypothetical protein